MSAVQPLTSWPQVSLVGRAVLLLASVISVLVGISGILEYPLIVLVAANPVLCLFVVTLGVWLGSSARIQLWLALALGNGAVIAGAVAYLVLLYASIDPSFSATSFAATAFFTAAAVILAGYSLLVGWLIRQVVRRLKGLA